MAFDFRHRICEAIADDFIADSVNLEVARQEEGTTYQIESEGVSVRTETDEGVIGFISGMSPADFIGGVTYALANQGFIPVETANPQNVARVAFALGKLVGSTTVGENNG